MENLTLSERAAVNRAIHERVHDLFQAKPANESVRKDITAEITLLLNAANKVTTV